MDDSHTDNSKLNKQNSKEHILSDSIDTKFKNRQKKLIMLEVRTESIFRVLIVLMRKE